MGFFTENTAIQHKCKTCGHTFNEYHYWETCGSCNGDGEELNCDEDGYITCLSCGGEGEHSHWEKEECEDCLQYRLMKEEDD